MARDIQVRGLYTDDIVRLDRLRRSTMRDARQSSDWHDQAEKAIESLIMLLATAKVQ